MEYDIQAPEFRACSQIVSCLTVSGKSFDLLINSNVVRLSRLQRRRRRNRQCISRYFLLLEKRMNRLLSLPLLSIDDLAYKKKIEGIGRR